jgi:hypothetical protein
LPDAFVQLAAKLRRVAVAPGRIGCGGELIDLAEQVDQSVRDCGQAVLLTEEVAGDGAAIGALLVHPTRQQSSLSVAGRGADDQWSV